MDSFYAQKQRSDATRLKECADSQDGVGGLTVEKEYTWVSSEFRPAKTRVRPLKRHRDQRYA